MCCAVYVVTATTEDFKLLVALLQDMWGEPTNMTPAWTWDSSMTLMTWQDPHRQVLPNQEIMFKMLGSGHDADPKSWLMCVKYAVGLWSEAHRQGIPAVLRQGAIPCQAKVIGTSDGELNLDKLCRAALHKDDDHQWAEEAMPLANEVWNEWGGEEPAS